MNRILVGDCLRTLQTLPDASVHCCVTSPPYWGLRDYGHDGQIGQEQTPEAETRRGGASCPSVVCGSCPH